MAGKYKGKILNDFKINTTKPTTEKVKEAIFNMIQFDVQCALVLDLFSGTGALGIEAISHGAKKVFFVDKNEKAIKLIRSNLTGISEDYKIIKIDYSIFLNTIDIKFDIIILDPPFATDFGEKAIELIIQKDLLNAGGIILFEASDIKHEYNIAHPNYTVKKKRYGTVAVYKIEKE